MKTNRGAAKRFRRTAKGFKHKRSNKSHILTKMAPKRKRQLRGFADVSAADKAAVKRMVPTKAR
ncbi:MAG: 50S ribosomal protein L35 [Gammaproteobacteria bacterium]|nr:50S ribosomal protein L35 [Gammaproteobacteria bacterium]